MDKAILLKTEEDSSSEPAKRHKNLRSDQGKLPELRRSKRIAECGRKQDTSVHTTSQEFSHLSKQELLRKLEALTLTVAHLREVVANRDCGEDRFASLPDEMVVHVMRLLPLADLMTCALVSKRWYRLACDKTLLKRIDLNKQRLKPGCLEKVLLRGTIHINLYLAEVPEPVFQELSEPVNYRLQSLDLCGTRISEASVAAVLARCPGLAVLNLDGHGVAEAMCRAVAGCVGLEELSMEHCEGFTDAGIMAITRGCLNLMSWNLAYTDLNAGQLHIIVEEVTDYLEVCDFSEYSDALNDAHIETITRRCPNLSTLRLDGSPNISEKTVDYLLQLEEFECLSVVDCVNIPLSSLCRFGSMKSFIMLNVASEITPEEKRLLATGLPNVQIYTPYPDFERRHRIRRMAINCL